MRVIVNALSLKPQMGGGLTFGVNLLHALTEYGGPHEVLALCGDHNIQLVTPTGCATHSLGGGLARPWHRIRVERSRLPAMVRDLDADLFLSLDGTLPAGLQCRSVAIFQNLIYFHMAKTHQDQVLPLRIKAYAFVQARYFLASWRQATLRADCCVCVSHTARKEFTGRYPDMQPKVRVIYEALPERFAPGDGCDLSEPYLLTVGTLYPHKRLDLAIDLLARLDSVDRLRLRIVGPDWGDQKRRLLHHASRLGVEPRVEFLGYRDPDELAGLYQKALCVCVFSETEAHPVPVAEAFGCAAPVLVADRSGMAELGGSSALKFTPPDLAAAARLVERLYRDEGFRTERRQLSLSRAELFRSQAVARQYWQAFEDVVGTDRPVIAEPA